jgi:hypothetical protein
MLKHYGNAILYRIVAATARAVQPRMLGLVRTSNHWLMAHRANQDLEQGLRKNRRHSMSLDHHSIPLPANAGIYHEQ